MEPLFTVLLALLFSFFIDSGIYERNFNVIIPALIASCVLIFSHIKKHHLDFNKYVVAMILASFFYALELILSRLILEYYSPISFYFLRCFGIFLISLLIFAQSLANILIKN
jgi:drug/metabolite transporter (DMT)-like permease